MRPRIVAVVQARLGSARLRHKVLLDLGGRPVLDWVVGRARRATTLDQVVVATTTDRGDDPLVDHCRETGYPYVRGASDDVLDRIVTAAASERADVVVRLAGHRPFVDPFVVDVLVRTHLGERRDYTTNSLPPPHPLSYPVGLDVEVISMSALTEAWAARDGQRHREHVTPYLYEQPGRFNVRIVDSPLRAGEVRWELATAADLRALRVLAVTARARLPTPWRELLQVWRDHPELAELSTGATQSPAPREPVPAETGRGVGGRPQPPVRLAGTPRR